MMDDHSNTVDTPAANSADAAGGCCCFCWTSCCCYSVTFSVHECWTSFMASFIIVVSSSFASVMLSSFVSSKKLATLGMRMSLDLLEILKKFL
jgi:hypothetical protein